MRKLELGAGLVLAILAVDVTAALPDAPQAKFSPVTPEAHFSQVMSPDFAGGDAVAIAWADFDQDGDLDAAVGYETGEVRLYRNDGHGHFTNIGKQMGFPTSGGPVRGIAWGDYDNSGFPSLYIGTANNVALQTTLAKPLAGFSHMTLMHNDGGKSFTDVTKKMGVDIADPSARQVMWLDYNNSGRLSLFVVQRNARTYLFRNDGDHFTEVAAAAGVFSRRRGVQACFFDFDRSGQLDIFVGNQDGDRDNFYRNADGKFKNVARDLKIDQGNRADDEGATGCSVVDYDNDGIFDMFVAVEGGPDLLYHNGGKGDLTNVAAAVGLAKPESGVGQSWADYDLDGRIDLYVGIWEPYNKAALDHLYRNTPQGFVDMLPATIAAGGANESVQFVDYDNDGLPDISLAPGGVPRYAPGTFALYHNDMLHDRNHRALSVRVLDAAGHSTQAGAEVRAYDAKGMVLGSRLYNPVGGYDSQSDMPVLFGLPGTGKVDIEVTFMSKHGRIVKRVRGIDPARYAGTSLTIKRDPE